MFCVVIILNLTYIWEWKWSPGGIYAYGEFHRKSCSLWHSKTKHIIQVIDFTDPSSQLSAETEEFAHFKWDIYQKVLKIIFRSLRYCSHSGNAHCCADGISHILYPGILIELQDAEEAAYFCECSAARATHSCSKFLVSHSELHKFFENFKLRTLNDLWAALKKVARAKTKGNKQRILVNNDLHNIPVYMFYS